MADFLCESVTKKGLERITIGVPYYGVERYLSHIISPFKAAYPKVEIDYLPAYPDEIIAGLLSMRVDVAVLPKVDFLDSEKLVFHDAFEEPVVLMLNRQHPLAAKKGVKISVLKNENFISLKGDFGDALIKALRNFFHQLGFDSPQKTTEAESIEAAALNMKQDSGVMILPGHLKKANISGNIKFIPVLDDNFHLTICLVHHPSNRNPMTEKFIRHYLDQAYGKIET